MGLFKLSRLIMQTLRGNDSARQLAAGIALGMLAGLMPKDNLLIVTVGLLIVVTSANFLTATISAFAFNWVGLWLEPHSHKVGEFLLTNEHMVPTLTYLYQQPLMPWTNFNNTIVFGSLAIGLLAVYPLYHLSYLVFTCVTPRIHRKMSGNGIYHWLTGTTAESPTEPEHSVGLIRWGWVIPRLLIIAAICLLVFFLKDRAIEYVMEKNGTSILGAKFEIGRVVSDLKSGSVRLHDVEVASSRNEMKNVLKARCVGLQLSTADALRKRFIVDEGKVTGLQFNTDRESSGRVEESTSPGRTGLFAEKINEVGKQWAGDLKDVLNQRVEENLETVRVTRELTESWPAVYKELRHQAGRLQVKLNGLKKIRDLKFDNPLRDVQVYRQTIADIAGTTQEVADIKRQLSALKDKYEDDRAAIETAVELDKANIRSLAKTSRMSGKSISELLLGSQQGEQVELVLSWLNWLEEAVPNLEEEFIPTRGIGREIIFPGTQTHPDWVVNHLNLSGQGDVGGDLFKFEGSVRNLSRQPKLLGKPTVLNLAATGKTNAKIKALIDQTGDTRSDVLIIHCPKLAAERQTLGSVDSLLVSVAPAEMNLMIEVKRVRDNISGTVTLKQEQVHMGLERLPDGIDDEEVKGLVSAELAKVNEYSVELEITGTIGNPSYRFSSDLGDQLAGVFNSTLEKAVEGQVSRLNRKVDEVASQKLGELNALIAGKHAEVQHILDSTGLDITQLREAMKGIKLPFLR